MGVVYVVPREPFLGGHFFSQVSRTCSTPPFFWAGVGGVSIFICQLVIFVGRCYVVF